MTISDSFMLALCIWREARGEGPLGMEAVACVIRNRAEKSGTSCYAEVVKPWQFSSITALGDPELILYPKEDDASWNSAVLIVSKIGSADITGGSTLYYAPASIKTTATITIPGATIPFPQKWNAKAVKYAATIGKHVFFTEI